ncbi:ACP S-malonyltransferase [Natronoglycomyces albus]|uniref:[acyl-carrier-protein] S-malonyltransferase n=1 Tax=Natronoglycomyces albus TaxID=2811108 RepID=A0A895XK70_9ACTN|nr:ACP S-malonyltransferase [Natronoglycomyces albus]QSB04212.1 acyltransferase domain-containing protein [Natronoglycomyces albus]
MLAIVAPGQGAQKPGFLKPWLDLPGAADRLRWWSELTGKDLIRLGTEADADEITDTANTQPLLVAAGLLAAEHVPVADAGVVAGHSVGELTAYALAGVLSPEAAVTLAGVRGREMAAACHAEPTTMAAVLGGAQEEVLDAIEQAGAWPANRNMAGQIVAAGPVAAIDKLVDNPPARARVRKLAVAGAFHTPHMAPAKEEMRAIAGGVDTADPERLLLSNSDGSAVVSGESALNLMVNQITAPVRWDACMETLADLGVTALIELAPAGTLTGMAKRALKGVELLTVNTPEDLEAAAQLAASHGAEPTVEPSVAFHVAVSRAPGVFSPNEGLTPGDRVENGVSLGEVSGRAGTQTVTAAHSGLLLEWLVEAGDRVAVGHPLARIQPQGER